MCDMKEICIKESCTGCHACYNVCPKSCIEMVEDKYGFVYPSINGSKCLDCNLCKFVCPSNHEKNNTKPTKAYAAICKNNYDYNTATSGGIATTFAKKVISNDGVVYGAAFEEDVKLTHIRATDIYSIEKIKGSKYVQSAIGNSYSHVKNDLNKNKTVLFIGTPCQVDGLKCYLNKEYQKLITCDIICHGVPSCKMLKEYFHENNITIENMNVSFRDKDGYYITIKNNGKIEYRKSSYIDIFYLGFIKALFFRESCYYCKYANENRVSDITLGDFWGFDAKKGDFPVSTSNGLSVILVNTEKGEEFLKSSASELVLLERDVQEAINGNKQLRFPSKIHRNYNKFRSLYGSKGFTKAVKKSLRRERIIYGILDKVGK